MSRFIAPIQFFAVLAITALGSALTIDPFPTAPHMELCRSARAQSCVIDGDTIRWQGQTIRLEDIDAPEIRAYRCQSELSLGNRATQRLRDLLNAGPVDILYTGGRDEDIYGRKLRIIAKNGSSLGAILVTEGLARPWAGARRGWCA